MEVYIEQLRSLFPDCDCTIMVSYANWHTTEYAIFVHSDKVYHAVSTNVLVAIEEVYKIASHLDPMADNFFRYHAKSRV